MTTLYTFSPGVCTSLLCRAACFSGNYEAGCWGIASFLSLCCVVLSFPSKRSWGGWTLIGPGSFIGPGMSAQYHSSAGHTCGYWSVVCLCIWGTDIKAMFWLLPYVPPLGLDIAGALQINRQMLAFLLVLWPRWCGHGWMLWGWPWQFYLCVKLLGCIGSGL